MPNYTQGSTRVVLQQPDLTTFQGNGSVVLDSRRTRPLWFDGRFLAARDLEREQNYFLQRQADLGQAGGFGVMDGLLVDQGANAQTIVIRAGSGVTPAGEMLTVPNDLTIPLATLAVDQTINVQFGLSAARLQPAQTRTGLFVIALRPVEFTANPIAAYPTTVQGPRSTHDGDIVEATAVSLIPYPNPASSYAAAQQQAALARQVFVTGNSSALSDSLLPLALVSLQQGAISWIDPYLVRRDTGAQYSGVRFGLTDPATQQAFLMQYDTQLQAAVAARQANGLKANFAATDYFQALPPGGRFPLDAIDTSAFSQVFFPQQMDVRLSIIPSDELPALLEDSLALPPLDLTLAADAYADLAIFAFIPVPPANFAALKSSLPNTPLNPTLPQVLANRSPTQLLQLYQGSVTIGAATPVSNNAWASAVGGQKYGFYLRRRSEPTFVSFATPLNVILSSSANPAAVGESVTLTAQVSPASAVGSVEFMDGVTTLGSGTIGGGVATLTTSNLTVGVHNITAVYGGDSNNAASTSAVVTQVVSSGISSVNLSSSANPSTLGQSVKLTAQVAPGSATGSVQFLDGAAALGTATLSGGTAVLAVSTLALGAHSITAVYSGDGNNSPSSSAAVAQSVSKAVSSAALSSSANPSTIGHAVTFTAQISPASATGSVQFFDGSTSLGTAALNGGAATFSTSSLAVGAHSVTAVYAGDGNNAASTSAALSQTVAEVTSSVTLSSSANPSTLGQAVTFAAQVSPNTATGSVKFLDGATVLGTVTLSGGVAALPPLSSLIVGAHSITAVYSGDGTEAPSTSAAMTQTVSKVVASVALSSSANPSTVAQAVTFTAKLSPATATGSVQFIDGATTLGSVTVSSGVATLSISTLAAGAHSITAVYGGDGSDAAATSAAVAQTISKVTSSVTLTSSANPIVLGQAVTFTAQVSPSSATGSVQFLDGAAVLGTVTLSGATALLALSSLAVGAHSVTAVYSGDGNNAASTSTAVSETVSKAAASVTLTASVNPSAFGQAVTFTAKLAPSSATGSVQFLDGTTALGTATVSGGVATLALSTLAVGAHSVTAAYGGDANDAAATSAVVAQTVSKATSSVTLSSSANPSITGQAVTLTARVTPTSATGSVQFLDAGKAVGTGTLNAGVATLSISTLAVGAQSITASYAGDGNTAASTSAAFTQTVNQLIITTILTTPILVNTILTNPVLTNPVAITPIAVNPAIATELKT